MELVASLMVLALFPAAFLLAGDGRIELSQASFFPPPYAITNSGSYVFTEDVTVTNAGIDGVSVQANNVTIDLNGFTLRGPGAGSGNGIRQTAAWASLTVRNGAVAYWKASMGLYLQGKGNRVENIKASNNGHGISANDSCTIVDSTAYDNDSGGIGAIGIRANNYCVVSRCVATHSTANSGFGIYTEGGCTVSDCTTTQNGLNSAGSLGAGIRVSLGSIVRGCTARNNFGDGLRCDGQCTFINNIARNNGQASSSGSGIEVTSEGNRIEANTVAQNDAQGIDVMAVRNFVVRNSAYGNIGGGVISNSNPWANFRY